MDRVTATVERTIGKEGRYANNPKDRGGETMWGITEATARRHGYYGPMKDLPRELAIKIYISEYYNAPGFSRISDFAPELAYRLFDTGVLTGPENPCRWLQTALNLFNREGRDYPDLIVDGHIGQKTMDALTAYLRCRKDQQGEAVLIEALESLFGYYLFTISGNVDPSKGRQENEEFTFGWFRHRVMQ